MGKIDKTAYIAPGAFVLGDVTLGKNCSVWYNAVVRGDTDSIVIEDNTNIQDAAILHVDVNHPMHLGEGVTVGHAAILHGCTIGANTVVGMGSIVLNDAVVGKNCMIGAGALVPGGMEIPDGHMAFGNPCKVRRALTPEEIEMNKDPAQGYVQHAKEEMAKKEDE